MILSVVSERLRLMRSESRDILPKNSTGITFSLCFLSLQENKLIVFENRGWNGGVFIVAAPFVADSMKGKYYECILMHTPIEIK